MSVCKKIPLICLMLWWMAGGAGFGAILTGDIGSHDPSRMINCDGTYYIYSTGGRMKYSTDRIDWISGPSPFPAAAPAAGASPPASGAAISGTGQAGGGRRFPRVAVPASVKALIPQDQGIWAPDVIYYNHQYYLYYSVAARDAEMTAIGLLTSPTLNPRDPRYHWTDAGVVTYDHDRSVKRSCIDPCPFLDANGDLWLSYGSGYGNGATVDDPTIYIMKLDNATGLASKTETTKYPEAPGHIEASYVYYHNGYYYMFWNSGGCCNGAKSSYTIHMARSPAVTGPYVDRHGRERSSEVFPPQTVVKNSVNGNEHGPGQIGILSEGGIDRCTYHYYPDNGRSVIGEQTIVWDADGWPTCGMDLAPGTYKISASVNSYALGVTGENADVARILKLPGGTVEKQPYNRSALQQWTVTFTSGSNADGYYTITSASSGNALTVFESPISGRFSVGQAAPSGNGDQGWLIEQTSDGLYRIASRVSGYLLSASVDGQANGPGVLLIEAGRDTKIGRAEEWDFGPP